MASRDIFAIIEEEPLLKEAAQALHLTERSVHLLPLFPLIHVAWADGKLQEEEVDKILEVARELGVADEDGAGILNLWLGAEERPSEKFFTSGLRLVARFLRHTDVTYKGNLLELCEAVAQAAHSLTGHVNKWEQEALQGIALQLGLREEHAYKTFMKHLHEQLSEQELDWMPMQRLRWGWVALNALCSASVTALIFLGLWLWTPTFVVESHHARVLVWMGLLLPPIGFFSSSLLTARWSPGDTSREGAIGTIVAIAIGMFVGLFFLGTLSQKFVGYNLTKPDPLLYPQCAGLKDKNQRCIHEQDLHEDNICRLMPNANANPASTPLGRKFRNWFPDRACASYDTKLPLFTPDTRKPKMFRVRPRAERVLSVGYYPLCDESEDESVACLRITKHPHEKGLLCRLMPNKSATTPKDLHEAQKFKTWFPAPRHCRATYARVYALWRKKGLQNAFVGYLPLCHDVRATNQECLYLTRIKHKHTRRKVCLVSDSPTLSASETRPATKPYRNWYPLKACKALENNAPLVVMFAGLGFALFAFFASWLGGITGERWQHYAAPPSKER